MNDNIIESNKEKLRELFKNLDSNLIFHNNDNTATCCCPFHEEKSPSFHIDFNGDFKFKCFGCNVGGKSLSYLEKLLGETIDGTLSNENKESPLLPISNNDYSYLKSRGISEYTQEVAGVVTTADRVYFPIRNKKTKEVTFYSSRSTNPSEKGYINKGVVSLYRPTLSTKTDRILYVTEGVIDCLTLLEQDLQACSIISGYLRKKPIKTDVLRLAFDGDTAGRTKTAVSIIEIIINNPTNVSRIEVVRIPENEDINSLHLKNIKIANLDKVLGIDFLREFWGYSENNEENNLDYELKLNSIFSGKLNILNYKTLKDFALRQTRVEEFKPTSSLLDFLNEKKEYDNLPKDTYNYIYLPLKIDNIKGGRLIVCCGSSGTGKTTLCLNLLTKNCKNKKFSQIFVSAEMNKYRIFNKLEKIYNSMFGEDLIEDIKNKKYINFKILDEKDYPTHVGLFKDWIINLKKEDENLKYIIIDHLEVLNYLPPRIINQEKFIIDLMNICRDMHVSIILIVQMSKVGNLTQDTSNSDYKGSNSVRSSCDLFFTIYKKVEKTGKILNNELSLVVHKNRDGQMESCDLFLGNDGRII